MHARVRSNSELDEISSLIGDIYDAALDLALWSQVLESTSRFVEGACSAIVAQDPVADSGQFYFSWGVDPDRERSYLEKYVRLNPSIMATICKSKTGDIESTGTVMPLDEFYESRFYREWAQPQGYCDAIWAVLDRSSTAMAIVSVLRHERQGVVDDECRRRMALLAPHFRRAVTIGKVIDLHKVEVAMLVDTLDGLTAAMFLVDAGGRIAHANTAGSVMLREETILRKSGGRFAVLDTRADQALRDIFVNAESGDAAVGTSGVAVPLTSREGERYVAHVLPLTSGARRKAGVAYSAVAAVFVRKAALELLHPVQTIAATFKLTPAEMRVLIAIVELGGVRVVAPVLGVSEQTVKTHLQRIFAKTDTNRQADLVKLVAGYMSPLSQ